MSRALHACLATAALACAVLGASCDQLPGKPAPPSAPIDLSSAAGFESFYAQQCAGCHGHNGEHGPARTLHDAAYLASVPSEALLTIVRDGVANTRMPGFGAHFIGGVQAEGGSNDEQLRAFLTTMQRAWGDSNAAASPIPWKHTAGIGRVDHGAALFAAQCVQCHAPMNAVQDSGAGSVTDPFYLRLVSDQHLRTSILFNHAPNSARTQATATEVDDLVAYLASLRAEHLSMNASKEIAR